MKSYCLSTVVVRNESSIFLQGILLVSLPLVRSSTVNRPLRNTILTQLGQSALRGIGRCASWRETTSRRFCRYHNRPLSMLQRKDVDFKSVDATVTEAVIPSVPRWIPKKQARILAPSRTPEHYMSQSQCTFKSNKLKVSGALKAFHLNYCLYVRDSRPSQ